ncbi:hypothetical protein KP509_08G073200 [Ceratopteris richardii]|uniref:RING-type E3 ubiquitin transferase n=1 Tax=Ceratopteris richardii TaxID=49495 RepID=A0A8T2UHN2_CERRI|nr:hypothetical protein KP509_08G073200 [Ceratopteris richardii]
MHPRYRPHITAHGRGVVSSSVRSGFRPYSTQQRRRPLSQMDSLAPIYYGTFMASPTYYGDIRAEQLVINGYGTLPFMARNACNVKLRPSPLVRDAVTVYNRVNVLKNTLRMEEDEESPGSYLMTFSFDADEAGSLCLCFLASVDVNKDCSINPWLPDAHQPMEIPFGKGTGQCIRSPSGNGLYVDAFDTRLLEGENPEMFFPLVILARTVSNHVLEGSTEKQQHASLQLTCAKIRKRHDGQYDVTMVRQFILVDGVQYELHDLYGTKEIGTLQNACVVCLSDPPQIVIMPCRHLCICCTCANTLISMKAVRCPLCRQSMGSLLRVRIED